MAVERRKASRTAAQRDNNRHDSEGEKEGKRHKILSFARERVPLIGFLLVTAIILCDQSLRSNRSNRLSAENGLPIKLRPKAEAIEQSDNKHDGFMVLGMHRSGTSMLTGLLYLAGGYTFGGSVYKGRENPKGFFERFDVVGQDTKWLKSQEIPWNGDVLRYDWEKALADHKSGKIPFDQGERAMRLLFKNPKATPWLQKDPRMCLVLKTWLAIMDKKPAILFTYRHPLESALSLQKRGGSKMHLLRSLKLWIAYNMRAIQNSKGLCIVRTTNTAVIANPLKELQRISDEMTSKCGVPLPPHPVSQEEINKFIDPTLQHHNAKSNNEKEVIKTYNDGTCIAYDYESKYKDRYTPEQLEEEREIYLKAMKIYCDLESGKAYEDDYEWPDIGYMENPVQKPADWQNAKLKTDIDYAKLKTDIDWRPKQKTGQQKTGKMKFSKKGLM